MSDKKLSILDRIKQVFAETLPTSYKLADGTDVTISLLDVGGDFTIGGIPATEGTYTLEDGTNVTVDSTGKIIEVADPSDFATTEYTLSGGDKVSIDKLEVGGIVQKDGVAVETGDYALEDGTTFTTDANGVITVLVPATEKEQEMDSEPETPAAPVPLVTREQLQELVNEAINSYKQKFEAENEVGGLKTKISDQEKTITKQGETITKMLELMTELANAPSGDPPPSRKAVFSGEIQIGKKGSLARYADAAQKLNEQSNN